MTTDDVQQMANMVGLSGQPIQLLVQFAQLVANAAVDEFRDYMLGEIDNAIAAEEALQSKPRVIV